MVTREMVMQAIEELKEYDIAEPDVYVRNPLAQS